MLRKIYKTIREKEGEVIEDKNYELKLLNSYDFNTLSQAFISIGVYKPKRIAILYEKNENNKKEVIGFAVYSIRKIEGEEGIRKKRAKFGELYGIIVKEKYKGRGYGKKLVKIVEKKVREKKGVFLAVIDVSEDAKGFFEHLGYKEENRITFPPDPTKPEELVTHYFMVKWL